MRQNTMDSLLVTSGREHRLEGIIPVASHENELPGGLTRSGLLAFMVPLMGIGQKPAIIMVLIYTLLMKSGLLCLEDDMEFFPPYPCVNIACSGVYERYSELREILPLLDNAITTEEMREMNCKVDVEGMTTQEAAHEFLVEKGLV